MMGRKKFPKPAGIAGMRNNQTITTPWRVKSWLYMLGETRVGPGVRCSSRRIRAKTPPTRRKSVTETRNITPMRLWSFVESQDQMVVSQLR